MGKDRFDRLFINTILFIAVTIHLLFPIYYLSLLRNITRRVTFDTIVGKFEETKE